MQSGRKYLLQHKYCKCQSVLNKIISRTINTNKCNNLCSHMCNTRNTKYIKCKHGPTCPGQKTENQWVVARLHTLSSTIDICKGFVLILT